MLSHWLMPIAASANTATQIVDNGLSRMYRCNTGRIVTPRVVPKPSAASSPPYPMAPVWMFSLASSGSSASTAPHGTIRATHRIIGP